MLMVAKSSPNLFWASPPYRDSKSDTVKIPNGCIFFKPSSRTSLLSSNSGCSCAITGTSALLAEPTSCDIIDYNAKIIKFCEMGNLKNATELLSWSQKSELELKTYCSILELCAEHKSLADGRKVHSVICANGVETAGYLGAKLVFMYVNCGDLREARRVFDKISNEKVFLWNLMINEYAKIRNFREGIDLFNKMQELGVQPNSYTFSSVMKCFATLGSGKAGENIHGYARSCTFIRHVIRSNMYLWG
ncbi:hypothetical protein FEM48_Zijuj01G0045300 [Ziziphus jujuba var. spinosa]|uniref:Pentatricopeptide repeat-containing protein n=1 Tax=Ziziphus jujuba var. spinosa TaxID=714518 RepID=A0A978VZ60_ZIZJJ|nr:hypothetical protein FEM48_Zijuj01G0045300 [Ziziphus jujuba var. spinosa]